MKLLFIALAWLGMYAPMSAETHTITNSGLTFSPSEITIARGDVVKWSIGSNHNVVEVSKASWDANGNSSNGGFSLPFGGGEATFNTAGIFYYVCEPHASGGMKAIIIVEETVTDIRDVLKESFPVLKLYPNPVRDKLTLDFQVGEYSNVSIELYDITGRRLQSLVSETFSAGKYTSTVHLRNLQAGKYIVYFKANEEVRIHQISKID